MRAIDADALMERLNRKKAGPANQRYTEGFNDCLMRVRSMVHSAPTLTPQNEWVRVEERLPAPKQNVLAYSPKSGIAEADYADGVWMQYRWSAVMDGVTHWMPLPAPPERQRGDADHA